MAGEREGRRQSNARPRRARGDTDREKQALCILKLGFPLFSGVSSTCFCSSPSTYSYRGFSLTPPFSRKLSVLPPWLVALASKNPAALFCADDLRPPSGFLPPQACRPHKGGRQHGLALHHCGRGPQLPSPGRHRLSDPPAWALYHKRHFPLAAADVTSQIQKLGSPPVQLTVLWKLTPTRWASLTGASDSSSWPSKWLPLLSRQPPSTGLPKWHFILPGLRCKDVFPWFCHTISFHRLSGYICFNTSEVNCLLFVYATPCKDADPCLWPDHQLLTANFSSS